jgi:hypothetical protein
MSAGTLRPPRGAAPTRYRIREKVCCTQYSVIGCCFVDRMGRDPPGGRNAGDGELKLVQ